MIEFPHPRLERPAPRPGKEEIARKHNVSPVYRLAYNEPPLGPSPQVLRAIHLAAKTIGDYPPMSDIALRDALAAVWGQGTTPAHFFTGCSGYEALELVARSFLETGDEVIVCPPTFGVYAKLARQMRATAVPIPLEPPAYLPDVGAMLAAVTARTRLVFLCNPNNPTGTMLPALEMEHLVENLPAHVTLVADEVYHPFVTDSAYPDSLRYVLAGKPVIILQTFSKAYGMPGLRLGYGIAPPEIADYIGGLHRGFHINSIALAAGIAALGDQAHLQENVRLALTGKKEITAACARLGLPVLPSQTNFLAIELPFEAVKFAKQLLSFGVMVKPLDGAGLPRHIRVSSSVPAGIAQFIKGLEMILREGNHV